MTRPVEELLGWGLRMSRSIRKALQIINLFSLERPEWGVSETARALGLPKSTTSELMSELMDWRLLRRASGRGRYRLGWRLFELSQTLLETTEFRNEARRVMEELVIDWGETVHLAVLNDAQAVYVEKLQPTPAVTIEITRSGALLPAYCSGVGKVLLAHAQWTHVARLLEHHGMPALTHNTITTLEGLAGELGRVREQGYAYDREETLIGLCCVAAPIHDFRGGVIAAAVSISVPAYRFGPREDEYTAAIREAARRISADAGSALDEYPGDETKETPGEREDHMEAGSQAGPVDR